jgi:DNA polymerase-1
MNESGDQVGGVIGFLKGIQLLLDRFRVEDVCVIWEGGGSARRRAIYPEYKHKRKPQKLNRYYGEDLPDTIQNRNYQVALLIKCLKMTPIKQLYVSDCEADDVIAYSVKYIFAKKPTLIVSSDRDYYQLVNSRTQVWSPGQKKIIDKEVIMKKFGILPENFCVVRCFCGDQSDGLNGIQGAGFKTMLKRFPQFGQGQVDVEEILKLSQEKAVESKIKLYHSINSDPDIPRRNWKLMYLDSQNLSAFQIEKILGQIDTFQANYNKMGLMRILTKEGIQHFDVDRFFLSLSAAGL